MSAAISITNAAGDRITGQVCEVEREAVRFVQSATKAVRRGDSFYACDGPCADSWVEFADADLAALTMCLPTRTPRSTARVVMRLLKSHGWRGIAIVRGDALTDGVLITALATINRDEVPA